MMVRGNSPRYLCGYTTLAHFEHKVITGKRNLVTNNKTPVAKEGLSDIVRH